MVNPVALDHPAASVHRAWPLAEELHQAFDVVAEDHLDPSFQAAFLALAASIASFACSSSPRRYDYPSCRSRREDTCSLSV